MKNVIYIAGIGATGKSSVASSLSKKLGIPMISTDEIYWSIHEELVKKYPEIKTVHWGTLMLVENQKQYSDFNKLKERIYKVYLDKMGDSFIIEGFTLMYSEDRQLVEKIIGKHWMTFFLMGSSFGQWSRISLSKYGGDSLPTYDTYRNYVERINPPTHFYTIVDFKYPLTIDRVNYQKDDFTDKKWDALKMSNLERKTVLDCGCNDGWIGKYCLDAGAKYVLGLDNNWLYLEEARKKGVDTMLFDLEGISDFEGQFDVVLCLATLHHLENRETFIRNASRIAKELFVLEVPIWDNEEIALKYRRDQEVFVPTEKYVLYWLGKYFRKVEIVGKSVSPGDSSHRLIFKAYK